MKSNKNYLREIKRLLFHFTEEDKQNNPVISTLAIQIPYCWLIAAVNVLKNELNFWVFAVSFVVIAYLLYRMLLLINRKWKFSPSTKGAEILCIAITLIYSFALIVPAAYGILTKASLLLTIPAGILLIFGCVLFLYRKNNNK